MLRNEFWIISTLISLGVIGGILFNWPDVPIDRAAGTLIEENKPAQKLSAPSPNQRTIDDADARQLLSEADNYFDVRNNLEAKKYYDYLSTYFPQDARLNFRLGFVYEILEKFSEADAFYQKALDAPGLNRSQKILAQLGQCRCWMKTDRKTAALEYLCRSYLILDGSDWISEYLKLQIRIHLIESIQDDSILIFNTLLRPLDRPNIERCQFERVSILQIFDEGISETETDNPNDEVPIFEKVDLEIELLQRPSDDITLAIVAAKSNTISVSKILSKIEETANLNFEMDPTIRPFLVGRTARIQCDAISLAVVLDCILYP
ncbi:MAG: tetratricopeptide repeat protein, partial [Planctomycetota bacterium]